MSGKFFSLPGRGLADIHRAALADYFGWEHDNFLGSSLQCNQRCENWIEFFAERRLRTQLRTARNNGLGSRELFKLAERVVDHVNLFGSGYLDSCIEIVRKFK